MPSSVVLINVFSVAEADEAEFLKVWTKALELIKDEPGFIDAKLHKSLDTSAQFQFINVAHWENQEAWKTAFEKLQTEAFTHQVAYQQYPALYQVVVEH